MQLVILAGGRGTRLGNLTEQMPKPMIKINNIPFLEILVEHFKMQGFTNLIFCTGYLSEKIESYFGDGSKFGVNIEYSKESSPLGTGGALLNAKSLLEDEFIVLNGDTFSKIFINDFISYMKESNFNFGLVAHSTSKDSIYHNNLEISNDNMVLSYDKTSFHKRFTHVDSGIYYIKKSILKLFDTSTGSLELEVFPRLISSQKLLAYPTNSEFFDIGTIDRIKIFEKFHRSLN